ncbi:MAG: ATP-binding protein [Kosmotoga sp.]|nr:MAG: ATP-binding protein [Kosmotoga sp.]
MDFSILGNYNPWWNLAKSNEEIKKGLLRRYINTKFRRNYNGYFDFSSNGLYILRGPRQIGKSTLIKFAISELIDLGERRSVLYLPLDTVSDYITLRDILLDFLKFAESENKRYVFLDEISMIANWQRAIKELRDNTSYSDDFFVLTGSSAWDMKRSAERLPGRRGKVESDKLLLPITFAEYYENFKKKKSPKIELNEILSLKKKDEYELSLLMRELDVLFEEYVLSGGIPFVINALLTGEHLDYYYNTLWDILLGDIERQGLSRSKLLEILQYTSNKLAQKFSWTSAASDIEIDTKTFQRYISVLSYNFISAVFKALDKNTLSPREKKQKKVYFYDTFLIYTLEQKLGIVKDKPSIIENIIGTNLLYKYGKNLENGLKDVLKVGYWYSKDGKEIDFLINGIPVESKYQNKINRSDLKIIKKTFDKGIIVSKKTLFLEGNIKIIPVSLFLYMI